MTSSTKGDSLSYHPESEISLNNIYNEDSSLSSNGAETSVSSSSFLTVEEHANSGLIAQLSNDSGSVSGSFGNGVDIQLITPDNINIEPGKIITANFQITNTSNNSVDFTEKISLPAGWRLVIPRQKSFTLGPSDQTSKLLTFLVPGKAAADTYRITYTVENIHDSGIRSSKDITIEVNPLVKVEIVPIEVPEAVIAGEEYLVTLRLNNRGNSATNVKLSVRSRPQYDVTTEPVKMFLSPGESQNVVLNVKTEEDGSRQITNVLNIQAEIEDGDREKSTIVNSVKVKILPKISTEFDPYHRILTNMQITYAAEEGTAGYQINYSGEGDLDEDGKNKVRFQFRGPDIQDINPYGRRDEYEFEYSYNRWLNFDIGDKGYSLSPLTKMYTYGRGAEIGLEPGKVKFISHFVENRWNTDDKQVSSSFQYDFSDNFLLKGNVFSQQLNATQYNNKIYSVQTSLRKYQLANADIEYAFNMNDTESSSAGSYQVLLNGRYGNRFSYDINKTRADPKYYGYYRDIDYLTGNFNIRLYNQIQARLNFRDYASNLNLDDNKSTANREKLIKTGLSVPISTRSYVLMDYEHFEKKDILEPANYDFNENTIILNGGLTFNTLNIRLGVERGIYTKNMPGKGKLNRERYRTNIIYRPTPRQYYTLSSNIGNYKYSVSNERSKSAGIKGNWKISETLSLDLNYWKYNFGLGNDRERDNIYSAVNYISKRNHTITLRAYYSQYRDRRDKSVFLTYSIPINVPTGKIKSVGILTGKIVDMDKEDNPPLQNVILLLNGISAITNNQGEFVFSSLKPGTYFLRIDEKSIGLKRVPTVKMPLEITITGGQKVNHEIGIISSGRIFGNVSLYSYGNKAATSPDSTDISLNTIQGLSSGELENTGGLDNVLLELNNDKEILRVLSGPKGVFSFDSIRPGTWSLKIYDDAIPMYHIIERSTRQIVLNPGDSQEIEVKVMPKQRQIKFLDQGTVKAETMETGTVPVAAAVRPRSDTELPKTDTTQQIEFMKSPVRPGVLTFTIQISSTKLLQNALDAVELYQSRGYDAFYNRASVIGMGDWYRVYAGLYPDRQEAVDAAQNLIESGYISNPWVKEVDFKTDVSRIPDSSDKKIEEAFTHPDSDAVDLPFTIQVASHRNIENATNDVMDFRAGGYNAYMEKASIEGIGDWYRVFAGRYPNRQGAVIAALSITEKGLASEPWVKNVQPPPGVTSAPERILESVDAPISQIDSNIEEQLPYTLQVASYQSQEIAMNEVVVYLNRGYDASIKRTVIPGQGIWFRVYAGGFATRKEAEDMARTFIERGYVNDPWIRETNELPDEDFTTAERDTVESTTPDIRGTGLYYTIQVASYRIPENALNEVRLFQSRGFYSFQQLSSVPGIGDWYRVYVGLFNTENEAQKVASILVENGYVGNPWIQRIELPIDAPGD
ncbi:SPOR domain-containing protein [Candidatus Latescibacterota bacterium]